MKKYILLICCCLVLGCQNQKTNVASTTQENNANTQPQATKEITTSVERDKVKTPVVTKQTKSVANTIDSEDMIVNVPTTDEFKVIINKKHPFKNFKNAGVNKIAYSAYLKLKDAMIKEGLNIGHKLEGFRTYERQAYLYNYYVRKNGKKAADTYSARPGYSEHHTGLAFDLHHKDDSLVAIKGDNKESEWIAKNAYKYGFVVRYLKGKEKITGYMYEPWHIRFVGNDAKAITKSGLTLEEYYGVEGGDYYQ